MRLFFKYIYQYKNIILIFLIFSVIFAVVFMLYNENYETVFYAFLLCSAVGIIDAFVGFVKFRKRYMLLKNIYDNLPLMLDQLPEYDEPYQEILQEIIL